MLYRSILVLGLILGLSLGKTAHCDEPSHAVAHDEAVLHTEIPTGSLSLAEQLILKDWNGQIPAASFQVFFDKFRKDLNGDKEIKGPGGTTTVQASVDGVAVPDSRSLQRKNSNFDFPRIAFGNNTADPTTFVGYAPEAQQMEIISWNPTEGRFDFSLVENFGPGKKPVLKRADRKFCMTCHQHGGPIFSRFPWSETSGFAGGQIGSSASLVQRLNDRRAELSAIPDNPQAHDQTLAEFAKGYMIPFTNPAFGFDGMVRAAAKRLQTARLCREICASDDKECQVAALKLGFLGMSSPSIQTAQGFELSKKLDKEYRNVLTRKWPKDNFAYPSSVLLDRQPLLQQKEGGVSSTFDVSDKKAFLADKGFSQPITPLKQFVRGLVWTTPEEMESLAGQDRAKTALAKAQREMVNDPSLAQYEEFNSTTDFTSQVGMEDDSTLGFEGASNPANPKSPRPLIGAIFPDAVTDSIAFSQDFALNCLHLTNDDLSKFNINSSRFRKKLLETDFSSLTTGAWPPPKAAILTKLETLAAPKIHAFKGIAAHGPETNENRAPSMTPAHITQSLTKYCAECHGAPDSAIPLPLDNTNELKSSYGSQILKKLKDLEMPPPNAKETLPPEMRDALKSVFTKSQF